MFDDAAIGWMRAPGAKVCRAIGAQLLALDGEHDRIHLSIEYPPKLSVSVLVNALRGNSSRLLRQQRPDLATHYWQGVLRSPSYFVVSAGGVSLETIKQYVEAQRASSAP